MKKRNGFLILAAVCSFYWVLDSVWSYLSYERNLKAFIYTAPRSYLDTFMLNVSPYQVVSRLMVVSLFAITGLIILFFAQKRRKAEQEREEAHDLFLTILNSIDATIYVSDLKSHEILFMNKCMIDNYDTDFTGEICYKKFRGEDKVCRHCPKERLVDEQGNPGESIFRESRNPITGKWFANFDRAVKWVDGRIVHLQVATDITELKELQERQSIADDQLRQSQKMESIGTLAGGIAHDFNNILASIIGFSDLAMDASADNPVILDYLGEISRSGNRARDLVNQILAFARQSDQAITPIQIDDTVNEVLKLMRSTIPSSIEIKSRIESDSIIMGNQTQIHQVVMNLCTNAAQAMEENGGLLDVSLKNITPADSSFPAGRLRDGKYIELSVSDTGSGISSAHMESIFEPYFTTKDPGKGTGMGLAMVHGIVESFGGKISVDSIPGKGTTFSVHLPIAHERRRQPVAEIEQVAKGSGRILFVDDEAQLVKIGSRTLEGLGYEVRTRTSSIEALELFRSQPHEFDLVISDMTMPNMTGDKLASELFKIRPDIPVILCTGYSGKLSESTVLENGIKGVLYKPMVKSELAGMVRKSIDGTDSQIPA